MKKLTFGLAAGVLCLWAACGTAGEAKFYRAYRIEVAAAQGPIFGKPVSFQEVAPIPAPAPEREGLPMVPPPALTPVPEFSGEPLPMFEPGPGPTYQTVELYPRVKYGDLDNVHPRAVKKIVAVKHPDADRNPACGHCAPPCAYVMICVPPQGRFEYDVKRKDHSKVEYDYGDYEIEITSKNGVISVDYDD